MSTENDLAVMKSGYLLEANSGWWYRWSGACSLLLDLIRGQPGPIRWSSSTAQRMPRVIRQAITLMGESLSPSACPYTWLQVKCCADQGRCTGSCEATDATELGIPTRSTTCWNTVALR